METTASCSLVCSLHFRTSSAGKHYYNNKCYYEPRPRNSISYTKDSNLFLASSFSSTFLGNTNFQGKWLQRNGFTAFCSPSISTDQNPSPELAVLLEVDGVLMDANRLGNRKAFNVAFQKLGLDCANWTEPIYLDLSRKSAGDEERMLFLYFNRIGWPSSLPTNEHGSFVKNVMREKKNALDEFMVSKDSPLRPGVEVFVDDAYSKGIPVVILTAYGKSEEKVARSIVDKLGQERTSRIKIVGNEEVEKSLYGQIIRDKGLSSGLGEEVAKEASKAVFAQKQRIAEEVASKLKLKVDINTGSPEGLGKVVAALRAGAEFAVVPVQNCVLIAGSHNGLAGAERIGMPCVMLRSSSTARGEFPTAKAIMDGFGGADLTISKLLKKQMP